MRGAGLSVPVGGYLRGMTDITDLTDEPVTWTPHAGQVTGPLTVQGSRSPVVRLMQRLEGMPALDRFAPPLRALSRPFAGDGVGAALRGEAAGHAVHPALVLMPMGCWTSAIILDMAGGADSRAASEVLLGAGLLGAAPAVATGLAEWRTTRTTEARIGSLHAALNGVGAVLFATSLGLRRAGRHRAGVATALLGGVLSGGAGYLGGHLSVARKVGTRSAAFATDEIGPQLVHPGD